MAEAIVSVIAKGILTKLGSGVLKEIGLWWGLNDKLENLKDTVATVEAVLLDAEEKSSINNEVKVWLGHLKEAFYKADDLLDDFCTEAWRQKLIPGNKISKKIRTFFSLSSNQIVYGIKMAHQVRDITQRLNKIAERGRNFHLDERPPEKSVVKTHSSPPAIVVGREDDKRVIMDSLFSADCEDGVGVISIVGIGGLGKTTLAQLVFNDEKVKKYFEPRCWVCVSGNLDLKGTIGKILGPKKSENEEINELKDLLLGEIKGKRYLLVFDDVWSDDLENLTDLLVGGSRGSRVIVTTRHQRVAHMTRPIMVHEMHGLSEMDSWKLFKKMAFSKDRVCSDDHKEIGKKILEKCCGVPLAIRAIGRLLYLKESAAEWRAFKDREIMKIDQVEDKILPILEISYNHLPSHLKNCFVYCRLFPKDSKINVPKLINYWIAQGFVKISDATQCPMDVGWEYFMELSWRSFFQEFEKDNWGNISFCKMHKLIHDLVTKHGVESVMSNSVVNPVDGKTLHASFLFDPCSPWKLPSSVLKAGNLRTFLLLHEAELPLQHEMEGTQWDVIFSNFKRLRTLDLHDSKISKIPRSISKLKHLKHLDLSNNDMKMLPNSITMLYNLLTLTLDRCYDLKQLPRDTQNLVNLTQLSLEGCFDLTHIPQGIGQLTSLHKLSRFVVAKNSFTTKHAGTLKELGKLTNLRGKLEIFDLGHVRDATEFQAANLKEKDHLQELLLDWGDFEVVEGMALEALQLPPNLKGFAMSSYKGSKIPNCPFSLLNLEQLRLHGCNNCRHLPPMHQLNKLKRLYIIGLRSLEYIENEPTTKNEIGGREESTSMTLETLETLELSLCHNLKGWWTTPTKTPRFPCLSRLKILDCPNIEMTLMPLFPTLKALEFGNGNVKTLKEILNTSTAIVEECASSSSAPTFSLAFSQLHKLEITSMKDLESLPEDLTQNLHSLKTLSIRECNRLKTLGQALQHLKSLEELEIQSCSDLNLFEEAMHWQALRSLRSLFILDIPTLEFFPCWFQQAMPSLQMLDICKCHNLKCLPERMDHLPLLQNLIINDCPQLSERYGSNKGRGVDWHNIASISNIKVNYMVIQQNGRYMLS